MKKAFMSITLLVLSLSMVMMLLMGVVTELNGSQENVYLYTLLKRKER